MEWDVKRLEEPKEINILDETYNRLILLLNENEKAIMELHEHYSKYNIIDKKIESKCRTLFRDIANIYYKDYFHILEPLTQAESNINDNLQKRSSGTPKMKSIPRVQPINDVWSEIESQKFIESYKKYGNDISKIQHEIGTKTKDQVKQYMANYFLEMRKSTLINN